MSAELLASNAYYAFSLLRVFVAMQRSQENALELDSGCDDLSADRRAEIMKLLVDEGAIEKVDFRWQATPHGVSLHDKMNRVMRLRVQGMFGADGLDVPAED